MLDSNFDKAQRRAIRTLAKEVAYEVLFEHLEEYKHIPKKTEGQHGTS